MTVDDGRGWDRGPGRDADRRDSSARDRKRTWERPAGGGRRDETRRDATRRTNTARDDRTSGRSTGGWTAIAKDQEKAEAPQDRGRRQPPPRSDEPPRGDGGPSARGAATGPPVDPDALAAELDESVRRELSSLPGTLAEKVASHLVMAGRLIDDDPDLARQHAETAHDLAPRLAAVRESLAITAYAAGDYRTSLREARTVRRMSGDDGWLPMIADSERGLGRPDKALDLLAEVDLQRLLDEVHAECLIVRSGARRDLGQLEAALAGLEGDLLRSRVKSVWAARLRVAYAQTLAALGRADEADRWLRLAVASDPDGESGAADLLAEQSGVDFVELSDDSAET